MKQPFCAPAAALRRVLDAAAALPRPAVEILPLEKSLRPHCCKGAVRPDGPAPL